jgi:hypothetical protein
MPDLNGFPSFEVEFTRDGEFFQRSQVDALLKGVKAATDVIVMAHGWNNDVQEARDLYRHWTHGLRERIQADTPKGLQGREFIVSGLLWPSKKFTDPELIPSGGAAAVNSALTIEALRKQIALMKTLLDRRSEIEALERAERVLPRIDSDPAAQKEFAEQVRKLMPSSYAEEDEEAIPSAFSTTQGDELLQRLGRPLPIMTGMPVGAGGRATRLGAPTGPQLEGSAASLGDLIAGIKAGAMRLLNVTTYYQMKERAGTVGMGGANMMLREIKGERPQVRVHLVGHSFGGRLVTAAATGLDAGAAMTIHSMSLLQAAFSHFGFAKDYKPGKQGFFRPMVEKQRVSGPAIITHSVKDKAVGLAYPIASRIKQQIASAIGDARDPFGGIGRNGAQRTPEAVPLALLPAGATYAFQPGRLANLKGDALISGHGDVFNPAVVHAIASAIAASPH